MTKNYVICEIRKEGSSFVGLRRCIFTKEFAKDGRQPKEVLTDIVKLIIRFFRFRLQIINIIIIRK